VREWRDNNLIGKYAYHLASNPNIIATFQLFLHS
jgi:hypothetical protein